MASRVSPLRQDTFTLLEKVYFAGVSVVTVVGVALIAFSHMHQSYMFYGCVLAGGGCLFFVLGCIARAFNRSNQKTSSVKREFSSVQDKKPDSKIEEINQPSKTVVSSKWLVDLISTNLVEHPLDIYINPQDYPKYLNNQCVHLQIDHLVFRVQCSHEVNPKSACIHLSQKRVSSGLFLEEMDSRRLYVSFFDSKNCPIAQKLHLKIKKYCNDAQQFKSRAKKNEETSFSVGFKEALGNLLKDHVITLNQKLLFTYQTKNYVVEIEKVEAELPPSSFYLINETTHYHFHEEEKKVTQVAAKKEDESHLSITERLAKRGLVALPKELDRALQSVINEVSILNEPNSAIKEEYKKRKLRPSKGLLLIGPPGTGKTMIAKHLGEILGFKENEIRIISGSIHQPLVGQSEALIDKAFTTPEGSERYMIIIDEVDGLFVSRDSPSQSSPYHATSLTTHFLNKMEGIGTKENFFVVAITNHIEKLDQAFIRRFKQPIVIPLPDEEARAQIFKKYVEDIDPDCVDLAIDYQELARLSEGFSGDSIRWVVDSANQETFQRFFQAARTHAQASAHLFKIQQSDLITYIKIKNGEKESHSTLV